MILNGLSLVEPRSHTQIRLTSVSHVLWKQLSLSVSCNKKKWNALCKRDDPVQTPWQFFGRFKRYHVGFDNVKFSESNGFPSCQFLFSVRSVPADTKKNSFTLRFIKEKQKNIYIYIRVFERAFLSYKNNIERHFDWFWTN